MKINLKHSHLLMVLLCAILSLASCSSDEPVYESPYGSIRDNQYKGDRLKVYVDDVLQTSVTQLTVISQPIGEVNASMTDPRFDSTLMIKGLMGNKKITNVQVISTIDDFSGTTTFNGKEYDVWGEFIGHPFETKLSDMAIVVYLKAK